MEQRQARQLRRDSVPRVDTCGTRQATAPTLPTEDAVFWGESVSAVATFRPVASTFDRPVVLLTTLLVVVSVVGVHASKAGATSTAPFPAAGELRNPSLRCVRLRTRMRLSCGGSGSFAVTSDSRSCSQCERQRAERASGGSNSAFQGGRTADVVAFRRLRSSSIPSSIGSWSVERHAGLEVWRLSDGKLLLKAPVAVGKPSAETPLGRDYYVQWRFTPTDPFYGAYALQTSAYSRLSDWPGGGVVGIHGTDEPQLIGGAVSHGCIRMLNRDVVKLRRLAPLGTPIAPSCPRFQSARHRRRSCRRDPEPSRGCGWTAVLTVDADDEDARSTEPEGGTVHVRSRG